jgi:hypothetical protein
MFVICDMCLFLLFEKLCNLKSRMNAASKRDIVHAMERAGVQNGVQVWRVEVPGKVCEQFFFRQASCVRVIPV